jgi:hypothetical protein
MTIQTLFDRMMLGDNQLDLVSGGADVARGLTALNMVQDWWEVYAARFANLCQTDSTFTTTANQVYTTWPTGLKRIDALWLLDANGNEVCELEPIDKVGGHVPDFAWPFNQLVIYGVVNSGSPREFYPEGPNGKIYWAPKPDAVYTIRGYGLWSVADYTAAGNTFLLNDDMALVMVPLAVRAIRVGLDRDVTTQQQEAVELFKTVKAGQLGHTHVSAPSRFYNSSHEA